MFEKIIFSQPYWLVVWLGVILWVIYIFFKKTDIYNFSGLSDLQKVYGRHSYFYYVYILLLLIITGIYSLLLSQPLGVFQWEKIKKNGIDIQIIFDVSYSMIAQDIAPSRIEVAKTVVSDFVSETQNDRIGLILFAGKPFTSIPLSFDYVFIDQFLWKIHVDTINQERPHLSGTAIGDALILWAKWLLQEEQKREKIIILLTDWEANRGIDPLVALSYLQEKGIKTYTIWVWKDDETFIDLANNIGVVQRLQVWGIDEKTLKKISQETGGNYYRADSKDELSRIFKDISQLEKTEIEVEQFSLYDSKNTEIFFLLCISYIFLGYFVFRKKIQF